MVNKVLEDTEHLFRRNELAALLSIPQFYQLALRPFEPRTLLNKAVLAISGAMLRGDKPLVLDEARDARP